MTTTLNPAALLDDLAGLGPSRQVGHRCATATVLDQLPAEVREAIEAFLDREDVAAVAICNVLERHGLDLSSQNLRRHRKRGRPNGCRCPRTPGGTE